MEEKITKKSIREDIRSLQSDKELNEWRKKKSFFTKIEVKNKIERSFLEYILKNLTRGRKEKINEADFSKVKKGFYKKSNEWLKKNFINTKKESIEEKFLKYKKYDSTHKSLFVFKERVYRAFYKKILEQFEDEKSLYICKKYSKQMLTLRTKDGRIDMNKYEEDSPEYFLNKNFHSYSFIKNLEKQRINTNSLTI